jgi:uncharacterized protein (DUF1697 family)
LVEKPGRLAGLQPENLFPGAGGEAVLRRYFAFLRAINVGGHTVTMETLCKLGVSFGLSDVETFIASGNLIFQSPETNTIVLEQKIASGLQSALGYEVATIIRSEAELATYQAFPQSELDAAAALNIAFLARSLDAEAKDKLAALTTGIDRFVSHTREVYWLCQKKQSESTFSNPVLEKTLGMKSTLRGVNTIRKLAARYASKTP